MPPELASAIRDQLHEVRMRDLLLKGLTVASGAVDAISFLVLGKVFAAFMTGNIAFLGLRVAGAAGAAGGVAIFASIGSFALGVSVSTLIVSPSAGSALWPRRVTAALGISIIAHAVFLAVWFASNGRPSVDIAHVLLACWGLAMGMQSAAVRALHVEGVFTTAATATVVVLAGDVTNWSATGAERRRLTRVLLSLFVGAAAGGVLLVRAQLYAPVLPIAMVVAVAAIATTSFPSRVQGP